ncbi:hypothetical protein AMQ84_29465 [Paenibacillus riograndensis]|uniref:Butirosin biosynthesis protein H N-terminal domain-containing protein n=1 Tax=Paenibacillus riograndensis TaxID=483937 RepID=A0A132TFU5_9BACL|nr:hypothetical protein [Paenibacillus riograndensis]KWX70218.1 hypothetical protein AMQ84_29465 [Paenibacillus riograndensis]
MKKVLLPVVQPPIWGYQFFAFPLSIVLAHDKSLPWFYSNYIQVCYDKRSDPPIPFTFYIHDHTLNPWLHVERLQRGTMGIIKRNIVEFIRDCLDEGMYCNLNVDEFFIPEREVYRKSHLSHDILIHGYDLEEQTFQLMGFTDKHNFASTSVRFTDFEQAYHNIDVIDHQAVCDRIFLYKWNESGQYDFDLTLVQETLEDYLLSRNTSARFRMVASPWNHCDYGLKTYASLLHYFEQLLNGHTGFDVRHIHSLWEHKSLMTARIRYMQGLTQPLISSDDVLASAMELERLALNARNLMLKYYLHNTPQSLVRIMGYLEEIAAKEKLFMEKLLDHLSQNKVYSF